MIIVERVRGEGDIRVVVEVGWWHVVAVLHTQIAIHARVAATHEQRRAVASRRDAIEMTIVEQGQL